MKDSQIGSGGITESFQLSKHQRYRLRHKEKVNDYEAKRRVERSDYKREYYSRTHPFKSFVGVDGEGRNTPDGRHAYFMLRAGGGTLYPRDGEERLRTSDCLEYLCNLPPTHTYVAFFFDYDVTKILEDLSFKKFDKLVHRQQRVRDIGGWWPVDFGDYQFDWFPRKEFKVRKFLGQDDDGKRTYSPWIIIHDVGTFFQASFIKVITLWDVGTPYIREKIAEGKALRSDFAAIDDKYIDKYNEWECILLAELMEKFRKVCEDIGYMPKKWQGPGLIAEAAMRRHNVPKTEDIPLFQDAGKDSVASFGRYAYYGPKFETSLVGPTPAPCIQFDINSAFPAAMLELPCLLHGEWERVIGKRTLGEEELSISFGRFATRPHGKRFMFGGFPVRRKDGSIHFPFNGKGWYWSFEARAAIHQDYTVYDSWVYTRHCDCRPFGYLAEIYERRLELGKSTVGIVLKLVMNSHYGKLVQSIGAPRYSNTVWASFITAWTRTRIADGIHSLPDCRNADVRVPCGHDCYMIASDAIYVRTYPEYQLDVGKNLGQWDKETHPYGLFLVQPGVYFDPVRDDQTGTYKTRGVSKSLVVEHKVSFLDGYKRILATHDVRQGDVHLPCSTFIGIRQAIARHSTKQLGKFVEFVDSETGQQGRRTSFEWVTKRQPQPINDPDTVSEGIRTIPYAGTRDNKYSGRPVQTIPYSRDIGGLLKREENRLMFEDQPDWIRTE